MTEMNEQEMRELFKAALVSAGCGAAYSETRSGYCARKSGHDLLFEGFKLGLAHRRPSAYCPDCGEHVADGIHTCSPQSNDIKDAAEVLAEKIKGMSPEQVRAWVDSAPQTGVGDAVRGLMQLSEFARDEVDAEAAKWRILRRISPGMSGERQHTAEEMDAAFGALVEVEKNAARWRIARNHWRTVPAYGDEADAWADALIAEREDSMHYRAYLESRATE